jgi:hypothetical protein
MESNKSWSKRREFPTSRGSTAVNLLSRPRTLRPTLTDAFLRDINVPTIAHYYKKETTKNYLVMRWCGYLLLNDSNVLVVSYESRSVDTMQYDSSTVIGGRV